jgi:deazaflavin-dependent oxidoreductase (nitroreductase family)
MASEDEVRDSPRRWVAQHIRRYVETDGRSGHRWSGMNTLLLTTRGRRSGALHRTALIYGLVEGRYVVVASDGGAPRHPNWYLNLVAHPEVEVQVGPDRFAGRARPATPRERLALWSMMASILPQYDSYQRRAERAHRTIPVVILERDQTRGT